MTIEEIKNGLKKIFDWKKIIELKNQKYIVNPLTDHEPYTTSDMLQTAIETYLKLNDFSNTTKLIWEEDRWWFLCSLMSYKTNIPFWLVKWNPNWYEWQYHIDFRNAYTEGKMYLNWIEKWDKVIIVEDIIDTWWTIISLVNLIKKAGIKIIDIIALAAKEENNWVEKIFSETWIRPKVWCYFCLESEVSQITKFNF